jgi:cell fate regulator YaaT (PSP1 superfamily)
MTGKNEQDEFCCKSVHGCHKLTVFNWLENIPADRKYDVFEVQFKNTRKGFYRNVNNLELYEGDIVAVEASPGHDIGIVSAIGPVAEIKLRKTNVDPATAELKKIYRIAKPADIEKWQEAVALEYPVMIRSRQMASMLGLNMKIGDVDFQGDKTKAIFYYIADERVDFRELIKVMAEAFRIRIEMRQIGARQEAGLIGGIGPCGRGLCCAQWITNFVSVSTVAARYQELSVNPLKLAGQCGKLKCCLNFELDTYLEAVKDFPHVKEPIQTASGPMFLQKTDALKAMMWFAPEPYSSMGMIALSVNKVKEIIELNKRGEKPELTACINDESAESEFKSAVGEDSLTRFDKSRRKKKKQAGNFRNVPVVAQKTSGQSNANSEAEKKRPQENKQNASANNNSANNKQKAQKKHPPRKKANAKHRPENPKNN